MISATLLSKAFTYPLDEDTNIVIACSCSVRLVPIIYVSLSQAVNLAKKRLAASANSESSSGPVLFLFCSMKFTNILCLTLLEPLSHSCSKFITLDTAVCCFADPMLRRLNSHLYQPQPTQQWVLPRFYFYFTTTTIVQNSFVLLCGCKCIGLLIIKAATPNYSL